MKKFLTCLILLAVSSISLIAQPPQKINYQGVARDINGEVIPSQNIGLRLTIRSGSVNGTLVYQETQSPTTNQFGLFNIQIGSGTVVSGNFSAIDWGNDDYFLQVEMDETGGTSFSNMGTSQMVSVPYALYAETAGSANSIDGTEGYVPVFTGDSSIANSSLIYNNTSLENVGVGTTTPSPSAIVDISSNQKGVLLPRMTTAQRLVLLPEEGLLVYDTDTNSFWYFDGVQWKEIQFN